MSDMVRNLKVLKHLFAREVVILKKNLWDNLIDAAIWPIMAAAIYGYILPELGIDPAFGSFMMVGIIVACWFYINFEHANALAHDLDGQRIIDYELTLPLSSRLVFIKHGCAFAFHTFILCFPLLFVGKLCLWYRFDMSLFSFFGFFFISVLGNLVLAFFALWLSGWANSTFFIRLRVRVLDPLFFMGCFMSSWATMHGVFPLVAQVMLLNPLTHAMEATRVTVFGQAGYLNFWLSVGILLFQLVMWIVLALRSMKKRLDYVVA